MEWLFSTHYVIAASAVEYIKKNVAFLVKVTWTVAQYYFVYFLLSVIPFRNRFRKCFDRFPLQQTNMIETNNKNTAKKRCSFPLRIFSVNVTKSARNSIKKEALVQVFSREFCEIFKNNFLYRTLPVAASDFGYSLWI